MQLPPDAPTVISVAPGLGVAAAELPFAPITLPVIVAPVVVPGAVGPVAGGPGAGGPPAGTRESGVARTATRGRGRAASGPQPAAGKGR